MGALVATVTPGRRDGLDHPDRRIRRDRRPQGREHHRHNVVRIGSVGVEHPRDYRGWTHETLSSAVRWTFDLDADEADEVALELMAERSS
jgi:hypothetical protein